jgi:predicted alpha/beta-fold hydrolase
MFNFSKSKLKYVFGSISAFSFTTFYFNYIQNKIELVYKKNVKNELLINEIEQLKTCSYISTSFLPFSFFEILYGNLLEQPSDLKYNREIIYSKDQENLALDWGVSENKELFGQSEQKPIIVFLPGLTGGSPSNYIKYTAAKFQSEGYRTVVFNPRGIGIPQISNSVYDFRKIKEDLKTSMTHIKSQYPDSRLYFIGFSLGSSYGTQYISNNPDEIDGMVSIGNPFNVHKTVHSLNSFKTFIYE